MKIPWKDKTKLNMRLLMFISWLSIGFCLWVLIGQIVHDKDKMELALFWPSIFVGWIGGHAYSVVSVLAKRITDLEKQSGRIIS
jgi:hypothetical protein